jgi:hypothetical protein
MDLSHWTLLAILLGASFVLGGLIGYGFFAIARKLTKDEAIDAATFLALRDLRERFEQSRHSSG